MTATRREVTPGKEVKTLVHLLKCIKDMGSGHDYNASVGHGMLIGLVVTPGQDVKRLVLRRGGGGVGDFRTAQL